jgi:hypothetical protein
MTDNNSIITRSSTKTPQVLDSYNSAIKEHTQQLTETNSHTPPTAGRNRIPTSNQKHKTENN